MLEMLRALAQAEANTMEELNKRSDSLTRQALLQPPESLPQKPALQARENEPTTSAAAQEQPGLMLLRATILGSEPEETELNCKYCNRVFRLQDGGASFEGNAACSGCEQHLNRDVVLPAVGKNRPHMYQVCEVAPGPESPKRPAWSRQNRRPRQDDQNDGSQADAIGADASPAVPTNGGVEQAN